MRKYLLVFAMLTAGLAQAQNDAVTNAFLFNKDGELDKAKEEIDKAAVHEKTKEKPKTWYFRGKIYHNLFTSKVPKFASLKEGSGDQAYDSFSKAKSLSKAGEEYFELSSQDLRVLFGDAFNKAIAEINIGDSLQRNSNVEQSNKLFSQAFNNFSLAYKINGADTISLQNAFICATRMKDYNKAVDIAGQLDGKVNPDPAAFTTLASLAKSSGTNSNASIEWIRKGIAKFPKDINLRLLELDWYSANGKLTEAKSKLEETVLLDSSNAGVFSVLGNIYDQEAADAKKAQKDRDASKARALASYRKALRIDPTNLESNFNLGVYHFNKGADLKNRYENLSLPDFQKKGKAMEADYKKEFANALPYFEACYKKDPTDPGVRKSLKSTYIRLGRNEEADKIPD
jgi:Tfp pilus assembly protein PilF